MTDIDERAIDCLRAGGVIAYPTESVYGLGCDPFNEEAVVKLMQLKGRTPTKGFIVVGSCWEQLEPFVEPISPGALMRVWDTWPGPVTWAFPAKSFLSERLRGSYDSIALRVSAHPVVAELCALFGPMISTSANREGQPPARDERMVKMIFNDEVDYVVSGKVGQRLRPTEIRDAVTGEVLRPG